MSTLEVSNLNDGTTTLATTYVTNGSAKMWVNFNGTGTVAIRDSLNAASLVDGGTGVYTINYTNAMGNTTYAVQNHDISYGNGWAESLTTTSHITRRRNESAAYLDVSSIWGLVHGDLA